MKMLSLASVFSLFFALPATQAQIQGTPISISEEGQTQKPGEDPEVAKARSELEASKVKPSQKDDLGVAEDQSPDGTLSGEAPKKVAQPDQSPSEEKKDEELPSAVAHKWDKIKFFKARRWFRLNVGVTSSTWSDISSELKDGSLITGFRLVQPIEETGFAVALGVDFLHATEDSFNSESTRSTHVALELERARKFSKHFSFVGSIGLEYADTNIRKVVANDSQNVTYKKFGAASTFGLVPSLGARAHIGDSVLIDLMAVRSFYFSSPESEMGGYGGILRFNLGL